MIWPLTNDHRHPRHPNHLSQDKDSLSRTFLEQFALVHIFHFRVDPCLTCNTDAMCTEADILTGKTIQTFYGGYKTEQRVSRMSMKLRFLNE